MTVQRIHVVGASGSGTTTLGAALAAKTGVPHQDSDHFFWLPTEPPFTTQRPQDERLAMLKAALPADEPWVVSGSLLSWGLEVALFRPGGVPLPGPGASPSPQPGPRAPALR